MDKPSGVWYNSQSNADAALGLDIGKNGVSLQKNCSMLGSNSIGGDRQADIMALIWANIQDLPKESMAEILDFIVFIRAKNFQPEIFKPPYNTLIKEDLSVLNEEETAHLEQEFKDYKKTYPNV